MKPDIQAQFFKKVFTVNKKYIYSDRDRFAISKNEYIFQKAIFYFIPY